MAVVHAALASRRHTSSPAQQAISQFLLQLVARFKQPMSLDCSSRPYQELCSLVRRMAACRSAAGMPHRYVVLANVLQLYLTPSPLHHESRPFFDNFLSLLTDKLLVLQQLGADGKDGLYAGTTVLQIAIVFPESWALLWLKHNLCYVSVPLDHC